MNSLDSTPLRYKTRSPILNFFNKNISKVSHSQNAHHLSQGHQSRKFREANSFNVFPVVKTPPAKRFSKIVNPFEAALTERLHLPIIASPTLFQRPPTPQHSSTQFAWTIDDVSSLQPANLEPHETQFHESPDPEIEAKAQSAINSFFQEQQIVPSPIDCPLRNKRIVLSEITGNTPISKPGRRIRDSMAQTVLSLPPTLPKDLEVALAPYFMFTECQQGTSNLSDTSVNAIEYDLRDASLRRKLFDYQCAPGVDDETFADISTCHLTTGSPPPRSPEVIKSGSFGKFDEAFFKSRLSDPMEKSSFGSLSPIAQTTSSPKLKQRSETNYRKNECTTISLSASCLYENYRCPKMEDFASPLAKKSPFYRFTTPERRSSVYQSSSPYRMANDSAFSIKISGLLVDTTKRSRTLAELDMFADETQDVDEDEMQISQLSAISNVSSESDTPRSKRRSTSRKNLSQSFTNQHVLNKDGGDDDDNSDADADADADDTDNHPHCVDQNVNKLFVPAVKNGKETNADKNDLGDLSQRSILYRTDSGFNEMTTSCNLSQSDTKPKFHTSGENYKTASLDEYDANADVSMICCSTPSKRSTTP